MGHARDIWNDTRKVVVSSPMMILEDFMMSIVDEYTNELPPFKHFFHCTFKEKQMCGWEQLESNSSVKVASTTSSPSLQTYIYSTCVMIDIASIAAI